MAVKCPKCGRPNPDEAYICQFCDSPLVIYTPPQIPAERAEERPEAPGAKPEETGNEGTPAWLEQLRKKKEEDAHRLGEEYFNRYGPVPKSEEGATQEEASGGLDEWLNRAHSTEETESGAGEPRPESEGQEDDSIPTWLSMIRSKAAAEKGETDASSPDENGNDWLLKLRGQNGSTAPATEGIPNHRDENQIPPEASTGTIDSALMKEKSLAAKPAEDPDFLKHLNDLPLFSEASSQVPEVEEEYTAPPLPEEIDHPIPDLLRNSIPEMEAEEFSEDILPPEEQMLKMQDAPRERIPSRDIPSWLASILNENDEEAASLSAVGGGETPGNEAVASAPVDVEPAKIPGWVQAMRPFEEVGETLPEAEKQVEESGPLAGIRGILPGEELWAGYGHPGLPHTGTRDPQKTAERVAVFNEILATENQAFKAPSAARGKAGGTIRWLMMILLIGISLVPLIQGAKTTALPSNIPIETVQLFKSISDLPENARVLVAIDYEPAYAGEMQSVASPVLNHLMVKRADLYLVSTSPTGPILAEQLLDTIGNYPQTYQSDYIHGEKYHILGYVPGGATGIQALNHSLTDAIPLTLDLENSSTIQGLGNGAPLSGFDAVLVISDQPDTLRYWIEQLDRTDGKPALWGAVNAQSAPMLRPYIRSGQLNGLSSGEYGGAIYERIFQQPGVAWRYWNVFRTGLLGALILILLGGVLNYMGQSILRIRRNKSV